MEINDSENISNLYNYEQEDSLFNSPTNIMRNEFSNFNIDHEKKFDCNTKIDYFQRTKNDFTQQELLEICDLPECDVILKIEELVLFYLSNPIFASIKRDTNNCYSSKENFQIRRLKTDFNSNSYIFRKLSFKTSVYHVQIQQTISFIYVNLLKNKKRTTIRELYYNLIKYFGSQTELNSILMDITALLGITRCSLNVIAEPSGFVFGQIRLRRGNINSENIEINSDKNHNGFVIDCSTEPTSIDQKLNNSNFKIESNQKYVIIVEKLTVFQRLIHSEFIKRFCILVTGQGYPSIACRSFLKNIEQQLPNAIFLGLFDYDPHGYQIFLTYKLGNPQMPESYLYALSSLHMLGLTQHSISIINKLNFKLEESSQNQLMPISKSDRTIAESLLRKEFSMADENSQFRDSLLAMLSENQKAELESFNSVEYDFLGNYQIEEQIVNQNQF